MPTINAYIPQTTPLLFETEEGLRAASALIEFGGWNHANNVLTPIQVSALSRMPGADVLRWVLDSLSAAAETGRLDAERYITQLFAGPTDLRDFRAIVRDAGFERWMSDRHHSVLRKLGCAECDCSTYPGVTILFDPAGIDWA
ncbi:hypothetical protein [Paraburkholderia tagetis]|uniref:Uncharacterized protein n=1 Tax=Paraburkholderia tagetis TaxID=2913261 RepID=A0A9X1ULC1_9BURK|nr:hypothetical protein [Paraburkholderia tagetis]MCG5077501.1 hypothetical protein [Paraburkholderia tagetis]